MIRVEVEKKCVRCNRRHAVTLVGGDWKAGEKLKTLTQELRCPCGVKMVITSTISREEQKSSVPMFSARKKEAKPSARYPE